MRRRVFAEILLCLPRRQVEGCVLLCQPRRQSAFFFFSHEEDSIASSFRSKTQAWRICRYKSGQGRRDEPVLAPTGYAARCLHGPRYRHSPTHTEFVVACVRPRNDVPGFPPISLLVITPFYLLFNLQSSRRRCLLTAFSTTMFLFLVSLLQTAFSSVSWAHIF